MQVTAMNLTNRPVILMLNSGRSLHLAPRARSEALPTVEVHNNDMVTKLLQRRVILLEEQAPEAVATTASPAQTDTGNAPGKPNTRPARKDKA